MGISILLLAALTIVSCKQDQALVRSEYPSPFENYLSTNVVGSFLAPTIPGDQIAFQISNTGQTAIACMPAVQNNGVWLQTATAIEFPARASRQIRVAFPQGSGSPTSTTINQGTLPFPQNASNSPDGLFRPIPGLGYGLGVTNCASLIGTPYGDRILVAVASTSPSPSQFPTFAPNESPPNLLRSP
jgi:hypothetical protein